MGDDRPGTFDGAAAQCRAYLHWVARRLYTRGVARRAVTRDDLYAAALAGLWDAWRGWEPARGPWRQCVVAVVWNRAVDWLRGFTGSRDSRADRPSRRYLLTRHGLPAGFGGVAPPEPDAVECPPALVAGLCPKEAEAIRRRYFTPAGTHTGAELRAAWTGQRKLRALGYDRVRELLGVA